ncbi:hypothetical protein BJV82DRAFT_712548 [Fennellomyces sp. T-0311]|nr:hypothetical protein BJV82DRAFT_712548 [Fennellomyces sp. T-0311]
MTTLDDDSVSWEIDAPKLFDFENPEQFDHHGFLEWFQADSSSESSQTRNNRRLRARQPHVEPSSAQSRRPPILSRPVLASRPLPAPSRPIQVRSTPTTAAPVRVGRDIIAALASTQKQHRPQVQNVEQREPRRFAQPTTASLNKARPTGKRDVAAEIKRITSRFAKKPQDQTSISSSATIEQSINKKGKEVDLGSSYDSNKENMPLNLSAIPYRARPTPKQPQYSWLSSDKEERLERQEMGAKTTNVEEDRVSDQENIMDHVSHREDIVNHVSHREDIVDHVPDREDTADHVSHREDIVDHVPDREDTADHVSHREDIVDHVSHQEDTLDEVSHQESTGNRERQSQHEEADDIELDNDILHRIDSARPRSLAQELASQRESIHKSTADDRPSVHAPVTNLSPSRQSKVSQQEQSLTNTTIQVGRERMRQWLDDQTTSVNLAGTNTRSTSLAARSPEKPRSEQVKTPSIHVSDSPGLPDFTATSSSYDVLIERMNNIRSQLLQVVNTSSINHTESTMVRNKQHLEVPIVEKEPSGHLSATDAAIDQRIARARRVIEESRRGSKKWFVRDPNMPVPPIMAPMGTKRKALAEENVRPKKITKSLSDLSAELHNTLSRRESVDPGLSAVERIERLKQSASRRSSRVSSTKSVYLPIAPTIPKSPAFATDTRSRLSIRERYN